MMEDFRLAVRRLARVPRLSIGAILMLALGIGAATAIFSIVNGVLLQPLAFPHPDELVVLTDVLDGPGITGNGEEGVTGPDILNYIHQTHSFAGLGGYLAFSAELSSRGDSEMVRVARMSSGVFTALAVQPLLGRWYTQAEDERRDRVTVLSYGIWKTRFAGDPGIVGTTVQLNRRPYAVVGVMPRSFDFPIVPGHEEHSRVWVPMALTSDELTTQAGNWQFSMVGRLKPGVSRETASRDAAVVAAETVREHADATAGYKVHPVVRGLLEETVEDSRPLLEALSIAVMILLLIACANTAGWMLVRAVGQRREMALRVALGARRVDLFRPAIAEGLLLSLSGGVLGLAIAATADHILAAMLPETLPRLDSIGISPAVALMALGLAVATGILCALAPAFAAMSVPLNGSLGEGSRTVSSGQQHRRLRSGLVVVEVAIALILLASAGLMVRSFAQMRSVALGYAPEHVIVANYSLPGRVYDDQSKVDAFNRQLLAGLQSEPGYEAAGTTSILPASGIEQDSPYLAEGNAESLSGHDLATLITVEGDYFRAMGISLLRGRYLDSRDTAGNMLATVVSRSFAERAWPGLDPIGRRVRFGTSQMGTAWLTVVGEVSDIQEGSPDGPRKAQFYETVRQGLAALGSLGAPGVIYGNGGTIVLRTKLPSQQAEAALSRAVKAIDPQLPLHRLRTMTEQLHEAEGERSFYTSLLSVFAFTALLLSAAGVYGVIASATAFRRQEMAIRLALGARRSGIVRLVLISAARLALLGCFFGFLGALFAAHWLRSFLFGVSTTDPLVLGGSVLGLLAAALAASVTPAARVAQVDPAQALRGE